MSYKVWLSDGPGIRQLDLGTEATGPALVSALAIDSYTVELVFDHALLFHAELGGVFNISNYVITVPGGEVPAPEVIWVKRVNATTVRLIVSELVEDIVYRVTASQIDGADGHVGSPSSADFTGVSPWRPNPDRIDYFLGTWPGLQVNTHELIPPYYLNEDPWAGKIDVPTDAGLTIDILDDDSGIDPELTKFWIQGTLIYEDEAAKPGWSVVRSTLVNGYRYLIGHSAPLPANTEVTWRIFAADLNPLPNSLDVTWSFETREWGPPYIINKRPAANAENVAKTAPVRFSIVDDEAQVVLSSIDIWIRGALVFHGLAGFALPWGGSSCAANGMLGFDFNLVPPPYLQWARGERVSVRVKCKNVGEKWMDETWYFTAKPRPFTYRIYLFVFDGVRDADEEKD